MFCSLKFVKNVLKKENDHVFDLLNTFDVPTSVEDINYQEYLIENKQKIRRLDINSGKVATVSELEERLNKIKNKIKRKNRPISERSIKKRESKKLKKNKQFKKVLQAVKKENLEAPIPNAVSSDTNETKQKKIFNANGKIVFSKFDFSAHPGAKTKKTKNEKVMKNPKQILNKMRVIKKQVESLQGQGQEEKVKQLETKMAWKKAFDKIDGKKVKDDPKLLYKALKRKTKEKKKSKQQWIDREKRVEQSIQNKQKKRNENINKKIKDKKTRKLKTKSKLGRVIPGF